MLRRILSVICIFTLLFCILSSCGTAEESIKYSDGDISDAGFEIGLSDYTVNTSGDCAVQDSSQSFEGDYSLKIGSDSEYNASVTQYIKGLEPGYYYLEARTLNEGNQEYCYIYGKGTSQAQCMTAVPRTIHEDVWTTVTVRGISVGEDGILEIGICAKGNGQYVNVDALSIGYEKDQENQYESLFGGAVSWLDWIENLGGKYYRADGSEADAIQIMAENGCNFVRLELYNNPGDYINENGDMFPEGYKDADAIFDLAVRANDKGMKIQLSFMYADYWGNDSIPSDWLEKIEGASDSDMISDILCQCLYDYTKGFMERLAAEGIYPEYVSLGNEMQGGILEPYGSTWESDESLETFCELLDAGYRAVKEVSPSSQIVLHAACNADDMFWENRSGTGTWFFGLCEENEVKYDVIGISYYPFWAQTDSQYAVKNALDTGDLTEWCNMMVDLFDKDILIMESGINWGKPGQLSNNGAYSGIYPCSPEGQRDFMYELINAIKSVEDGRCVGDLYWDPVLVRQEGVGWAIRSATNTPRENCVETTTYFDYNHKALPVLNAYRYNTIGCDKAAVYGTVTDSDGNIVEHSTFTLSFCGREYSLTTDRYGDFYVVIDAGKGSIALENESSQNISLLQGEALCIDFRISK